MAGNRIWKAGEGDYHGGGDHLSQREWLQRFVRYYGLEGMTWSTKEAMKGIEALRSGNEK